MADNSLTTQPNGALAASTPTALGEITGGAEITAPSKLTLLQVLLIRYRKLLMFVAAGLMFMGFVGLMLWSGETPYRTLYSGLGEKDAAAMVEFLQKEQIPYKLQGANTITVPSDRVYPTRLKIASKNLQPKSGTGYELFDKKNQFGMSDFTQKLNLQRALQGELARTLEVIPQVSSARVQLVMPKESAFAERDRKASASVMLQLGGSGKLPQSTVAAVQNLVAASVPDLSVADVTVVDSSGNLLSSKDKDQPNSQGETMQQYQISMEARLEHRLTSMLEQVVGAGQAVVRVSADIDRQFVEQNNTNYNPDEQVVRSQHTITEDRNSTDAAAIGVPGLASNTPGNNPAVTADGSVAKASANVPTEKAKRNENTTNYEISSVTEHRVIPFGAIKKLSVAVVVGGSSSKDDKGVETFTPLGAAQLSKLRGLVNSAIGFNEDRGDAVTIQSMPIHDISSRGDAKAVDAIHSKAFYMDLARYGLAALALILMAWFLLRPLAQRLSHDPNLVEEEEEEDPFANLSEEAYARLAMVEKARIAVKHDPERAAKVISEWAGSSA